MARIIMMVMLGAALCSCVHVTGNGSAFPYEGPLTDNAGKPVQPPTFDGGAQ